MGQLIYCFVARGTVVLAEFTSFKGNFNTIALQCLEKMPQENNKFTFPHGSHTLNYLLDNGYAYMVLADQDVTRQIVFAFLERVKEDFTKRYGSKASTLAAHSLDKEYGSKLREHIKYVEENPEEISKFAKIKSQVAEVKGVMKDNIDKVLQRGEKMELLQEKADNLQDQANMFKKKGGEIRKKEWWNNMKVKAVVIGILIVLGLVIYLSICHGFVCH